MQLLPAMSHGIFASLSPVFDMCPGRTDTPVPAKSSLLLLCSGDGILATSAAEPGGIYFSALVYDSIVPQGSLFGQQPDTVSQAGSRTDGLCVLPRSPGSANALPTDQSQIQRNCAVQIRVPRPAGHHTLDSRLVFSTENVWHGLELSLNLSDK